VVMGIDGPLCHLAILLHSLYLTSALPSRLD
jgi:hypothetical protein